MARGLVRQVLLPSEHGGWAFLAEPLLLGMLVAPSAAGALVAAAAVSAFLGRRPLRIVLSDRRKGRRYPRTAVAGVALAGLAVAAAAAVAGAVLLARGPLLLALGLAAPLGAVALGLDLGQRARDLAGELAAALALGGFAPAIALAAGLRPDAAFGLWGVLAARSIPSILYVRARVRLDRGAPAPVAAAWAASALALPATAALARAHAAPWIAVGAMALLLARALWGLSAARPRLTTLQLGLGEIALGLLTVIAVARAVR